MGDLPSFNTYQLMKIIVDSREQLPLKFSHPFITEVIVQKLDVGDYGVEFEDKHRPPFYFDRKSIGDLFGTMGNGYPRFKECIKRAQESDVRLFIIIEGTLTDCLKGYEHSSLEGVSVVYKLFTLWVKYGIIPVFCSSREEMASYIVNFYIAVGKRYIKDRHEKEKLLH